MNWLLIIVLAVIAIATFNGYRKGLIMTVFSVGSIFVTIILASILTPIIGSSIRSNEKIYNSVNEKVVELLNLESVKAKTDAEQEKAIDELALPQSIKKILKENNNVEVFRERQVNNFKEYVADCVTRVIINAIVYLCVFIVARIIVYFVAKGLDVLGKMPVVNEFNTAGGTAVGVVQGLLIVWFLFVIVTMLASTKLGASAMACIEGNWFLEFLFKNNLMLKVITSFIG
ncbi:MAG: CvpA family protein [Lachnospiraceae bacterium]|nr:CvpA family protein [Lachnospiraceae bacterium]